MDSGLAGVAVLPSRRDAAPVFARRTITGSALPYSLRAISRPATEFSGDFFLTMQIGEALWFALGDFAGHGLRSAIHMAMVQEELERIIPAADSAGPVSVVAQLDATLRQLLPINRFATVVVGRASRDGSLNIVNAGHSQPMILRANGALELIDSHGPVVGLLPGARWLEQEIRLRAGDRIVLYSDGIGEAAARCCLNEFGKERLADAVRNADAVNPLDSILRAVDAFTEGEQHDDQTLLILSYEGRA